MDKCEMVQDSLTAVHRFVAYNAGWLQQALGEVTHITYTGWSIWLDSWIMLTIIFWFFHIVPGPAWALTEKLAEMTKHAGNIVEQSISELA